MAVDNSKLEEEVSVLRFYKIVLSWDYLRIRKNKGQRDLTSLGLKKVKDKYSDVDDYLSTFEPLLFEEVKAQIIQGRDEEEETEWLSGLTTECKEAGGFHLLSLFGENDWGSLSQNDLLLLSKKKFGGDTELPATYAFALVEHRQPDKIRLRMHLSEEVKRNNTAEVKSSPRLLSMRPLVSEIQKYWWIMKICSLSTIVREYVALRSISFLPFKELILTAAESSQRSEDQAWKISRPLREYIESNHNVSQLEAIDGPPGTGKTQTILGILSAVLHATPGRIQSKGKSSEIKRGPELPGQANNLVRIVIQRESAPLSWEKKPEVVNSSRKYRLRVLVCAPSNSALDEIVLRLLNTGIRDENDRAYNPKIVRIGLKPHHSVQSVSMDYLVEQKLAGMDFQTGDKQKQGAAGRDRDSVRASIMDEAVIVFSTLSFSGSALFSKVNRTFDVVIIDEAAQAVDIVIYSTESLSQKVEPATLVPLANGCKQVGDPVQLPATVISSVAEKFGYGMSLFKRFQRAGYPVHMLKTQYRMHPEIRSFPSREFYAEALEDGPDVKDNTKRSWHKYRCFGPFCFFDLHEGRESQPSGSGSWENVDEVDFVLLMYQKLMSGHPELKSSSRLAIISPYRHQVKLLRDRFRQTFGVESDKVVDINTVDGFQGREKDVAIFSCVRASKDRGIGFVADFRRMNVGITRARSSVLVVGSATALKVDKHWQNLIESAERRSALFKVSKPYTDFFSDANLKSMEVESMVAKPEIPLADMEINVPVSVETAGADQGPAEDDWGDDGDADVFDGGMDED
ncbi:hypothetical protein RJ639_010874 [Escallonia herrerae]|uniref:Helicase MAGATAMA 3 n=1 Tax=Escallonia herrerae TaxID=1293975 RepID=A0AA89APR2_9ASTE|nr:hypothetical protein RJ639_010874 [Escallonia herrerae]